MIYTDKEVHNVRCPVTEAGIAAPMTSGAGPTTFKNISALVAGTPELM